MGVILALLVSWAVIYSTRQTLKLGPRGAVAIVAIVCTASLSLAFLFTLVILIRPDPVLRALRSDLTGAMFVGAVAMAGAAVTAGCTAVVCVVRKFRGWTKVFLLLAIVCLCQGSVMVYILFLH